MFFFSSCFTVIFSFSYSLRLGHRTIANRTLCLNLGIEYKVGFYVNAYETVPSTPSLFSLFFTIFLSLSLSFSLSLPLNISFYYLHQYSLSYACMYVYFSLQRLYKKTYKKSKLALRPSPLRKTFYGHFLLHEKNSQ